MISDMRFIGLVDCIDLGPAFVYIDLLVWVMNVVINVTFKWGDISDQNKWSAVCRLRKKLYTLQDRDIWVIIGLDQCKSIIYF